MAKGSHQTWGGWETRTCWNCGVRLVLARGTAIHCQPAAGRPFSLCGDHLHDYSAAWHASTSRSPLQTVHTTITEGTMLEQPTPTEPDPEPEPDDDNGE